jgi:hypothetical protein
LSHFAQPDAFDISSYLNNSPTMESLFEIGSISNLVDLSKKDEGAPDISAPLIDQNALVTTTNFKPSSSVATDPHLLSVEADLVFQRRQQS